MEEVRVKKEKKKPGVILSSEKKSEPFFFLRRWFQSKGEHWKVIHQVLPGRLAKTVGSAARHAGLYLVRPGVFVPRGELQDPDDLVDLSAHLLKGEPPVPLRLLHAGASAALGRHKDLDGCATVESDDSARMPPTGTRENIYSSNK